MRRLMPIVCSRHGAANATTQLIMYSSICLLGCVSPIIIIMCSLGPLFTAVFLILHHVIEVILAISNHKGSFVFILNVPDWQRSSLLAVKTISDQDCHLANRVWCYHVGGGAGLLMMHALLYKIATSTQHNCNVFNHSGPHHWHLNVE